MLRIVIAVTIAAWVSVGAGSSDETTGTNPETVGAKEPSITLTPYLHLLALDSPLPYLPFELPMPSLDLNSSLRERTFLRDARYGFELGAEVYRSCTVCRCDCWKPRAGLKFGGHMRRMQYLSHDLSYKSPIRR